MSDSAQVVFAVVGAVAAAAWVLAAAEWVATLALASWAYRLGPTVLREIHPLPVPREGAEGRWETENAVARLVPPALCLFRFRVRLFGFTLHTPFLVKGTVRWQDSGAVVEGRIPLFPLVFLAMWLIGCTVGGAMLATESETFWVGIGLLAIGWLFPICLALLSIPFEKDRARTAFAEVEALLGAPAQYARDAGSDREEES
jgi:hypothetical protein